MPRYDYRCLACDTIFETTHAIGGSADACEACGGKRLARHFAPEAAPQIPRDWTQSYQAPNGGKFHRALGRDISALSKKDVDVLCKQKGIVLDNRLTPREQTLREYSQHVKAGGERVAAETLNPTPKGKTVLEIMREKKVRFG